MWRPPVNLRLLALVIAVPCNGYALGLGDIHVKSALGRPLDAYIEIVGASADDLAKIKASIADQTLFQRHGLDRPDFLSSVTITVGQDKSNGPILVVRSTDASVEPMLSLLVDVQSPAGQLLREYTILLDPPGLRPEQNEAGIEPEAAAIAPSSATPAAAAIITPIAKPIVAPNVAPKAKPITRPNAEGATHTIARHDTLERIVVRAGAHSSSERHRMMVAIYRDNPRAFANNMNALRVGGLLRLPDAAELSAISAQDADHEFSAQMMAWRTLKHGAPRRIRAAAVVATTPDTDAETIALTQKIETLEKSLSKVREELNQPMVVPAAQPVIQPVVQSADPPVVQPAVAEIETPLSDEKPPAPSWSFGMSWVAAVGGCAFALALGVWFHRRGRRFTNSSAPLPFLEEPDELIVHDLKALASQRAGLDSDQRLANTLESTPRTAGASAEANSAKNTVAPVVSSKPTRATGKTEHTGDTTVVLAIPDAKDEETVELTLSNFNPEATINTMHVTIPDSLHNQESAAERRKNPVDVLRQAIEREPTRSDLRLKLLELYYIAAAQNRKAFLEIAHQLADNINLTSPQEWSQIVDMGRKIAPDDPLFAEERNDEAVA